MSLDDNVTSEGTAVAQTNMVESRFSLGYKEISEEYLLFLLQNFITDTCSSASNICFLETGDVWTFCLSSVFFHDNILTQSFQTSSRNIYCQL